MNVYGIDFTSRPSRSKAITCAKCQLDGDRLLVNDLQRLESLDAFGAFLDSPGPWIAGIDFPFGQPRPLVEHLNWPGSWAEYVVHVAGLSREGFRGVLEDYKRDRAKGDREHLRLVDRLTGAQSPSKLYGVPVALMFYEGAPRLLQSAVSVIPVRPNADDRIVVEAYPALVVRALVGKDRYKPSERGDVQAVAQNVRDRIVRKLSDGSLFARYRLRVDLRASLGRVCIDDADGDSLDAVLAAVQAAWSWVRRDEDYGVPQDCDRVEGWIVDPVTRPSLNSSITRVRPVFRQLLGNDSTGASWLSQVEPPRVSERLHCLGGWSPWEDQGSTHRRSRSGRFGWCATTSTSTTRSGRRSGRWPRRAGARQRRCAIGCGRSSVTPDAGRA